MRQSKFRCDVINKIFDIFLERNFLIRTCKELFAATESLANKIR